MTLITSASPMPIHRGVLDNAGGTAPAIRMQLPAFLPAILTFASDGPTNGVIVTPSQAVTLFGSEFTRHRDKFTNPFTPFYNVFARNANTMQVYRLKPEDAGDPANIMLSCEVVEDDIPTYERDEDGYHRLDSNGAKIPTGSIVPGIRIKWKALSASEKDGLTFAERAKRAGELIASGGEQSEEYPILDLSAPHFGSRGNNKGLRLWSPTTRSASPLNTKLVERVGYHLFRTQLVERADAKSTGVVVNTNNGGRTRDFTFMDRAFDPISESEMDFDTSVIDAYRDMNAYPRKYGPFEDYQFYKAFYEEVAELIVAAESNFTADLATMEDAAYQVNPLSATYADGRPYEHVVIEADGLQMTETTTIYANGGDDGDMSIENFNALAKAFYDNYKGTVSSPALHPCSWHFDPGYSIDTKLSLASVIGKRKDTVSMLATQDVTASYNGASAVTAINSTADDVAISQVLKNELNKYPEDVEFGTPALRATISIQASRLIDKTYPYIVPANIEIAKKLSAFQGAANGEWKQDQGFDVEGRNVGEVLDPAFMTSTDMEYEDYIKFFDNDVIWWQAKNPLTIFCPQWQTIYDDETSPLNNLINMSVIPAIRHACTEVWSEITGGSKYTPQEALQKSDELLLERIYAARFDKRFTFDIESFYSDIDAETNYSMSARIRIGLPNSVTVMSFIVEAENI